MQTNTATKARSAVAPATVETTPADAPTGALATNATLRTQVKAVLSKLIGMGGRPRLKWYMERADGDFDAPGGSGAEGGPVVKAAALEGKRGAWIFVEELAR